MNTKVVIFYCSWSNYPGLQLSQLSEETELEQKLLVCMCSGRISAELILEAFHCGAWGVMVTACPPGKCEHDGNYKIWGRIVLIKTMLQQLGLESQRLKLEWIDKEESQTFQRAVDTFMDEIKALRAMKDKHEHS
jgi:coenzyme F420-reducing hydrogenase delta subunit